MEQNIFEAATRKALRYPTSRGLVSTEQLWQMPLSDKTDFNLDKTARVINAEFKASTEESFVKPTPTAKAKELELMLEVVKHVIAVKLDEKQKAAKRMENAAKRQKLLEQLEKKQDASLEAMSEEDIKKQLAAIDDEEE